MSKTEGLALDRVGWTPFPLILTVALQDLQHPREQSYLGWRAKSSGTRMGKVRETPH